MNINRHNYEEYFLLYVDRELTAAERTMVEAFVAANPDLKAELELLEQATFSIDAQLDSEFKAQLLKPVTADITEEQLLLFVDDELTASETAKVKESIASDTVLQNELRWLQRSKLTADTTVVFPDKSLLYKETQPARVFYMSTAVRRWSAAAAVVLMLGTGWWLMNKQSGSESVAVQQTEVTKPVVKEDAAVTNPAQAQLQSVQQAAVNNNTVAETKQAVENKLPIVTVKEKNQQAAIVKNQQPTTVEPKQQVQAPVQQNSTASPDAVAANETRTEKKSDNTSNNPNTSSVQQQTSTTQPQATYAAYTNNDEEGDDDNSLLNEDRQRSSGLKGLLKKARRTLERRTGIKTGDSQVRFAVFAVNTQ